MIVAHLRSSDEEIIEFLFVFNKKDAVVLRLCMSLPRLKCFLSFSFFFYCLLCRAFARSTWLPYADGRLQVHNRVLPSLARCASHPHWKGVDLFPAHPNRLRCLYVCALMPPTFTRTQCRRRFARWNGDAHSPTLTCTCRLLHGPAPRSAEATKLRRAMWMRMHPVERWTSLVDIGRRSAYLIERPQASSAFPNAASSGDGSKLKSSRVLGDKDEKVHFSASATEAHRQLCAALPYPARLHLAISLLMWVRCLRDVQDTLARVRLPYAPVRRPQRYAVADVFPTRLSEYWVDAHTTVSIKMNVQMNSTAEQVPAPHTWCVETSATMEDAATESTVALDAGRVLHGRREERLVGKALLRQVQGVQPRASADDATAARLTDGGSEAGRRRRRRRLLHGVGPGTTLAVKAFDDAVQPARRATSLEFQNDAARRVPPVSLELQPTEDAVYHGNANRGEGCPMDEDGASTPNPIYIHVPATAERNCSSGSREDKGLEELLRCCVMAHAAIFSSLYVEGRVVDFSTNHAVVAAYAHWLLEDLVADHYMCITLVPSDAVSHYRPYFPAWCMRRVMVVLPPRYVDRSGRLFRRGGGGYSKPVLQEWAARIAQAAPCSVLVEGGDARAAAYVEELKNAVRLAQSQPLNTDSMKGDVVEWVPIMIGSSIGGITPPLQTKPNTAVVHSSLAASAENDGKGAAASASFQPRRTASSAAFSLISAITLTLQRVTQRVRRGSVRTGVHSNTNENGDVSAAHAARQQRFLAAVQETLRDRFYQCELLYSPNQSCLSPYRFERWVWEQLPDNIRVVGVNTSPLDALFYFPQGVFLTQKVGNAFRYRAVERTVVAKGVVPSWWSHPLRWVAMQLRRLRSKVVRTRRSDAVGGLHADLSLLDRELIRRTVAARRKGSRSAPAAAAAVATTTVPSQMEAIASSEEAANALVRERVVEYLVEPSKSTLFGLATARFFRV